MELHWPLILFTLFMSWSAGLFGTQCYFAIKGEGKKTQMTAWIVAAVLLIVGGIAVFMHLQHWERIFNGFGHITSGITQELIAIVVLAVVALIYLVYLRRSEDGASVPKWVAILGIVASALLLVVMAHSYMMPSRPAWDSFFQILCIVGNACILGPATMALLCAMKGEPTPFAAQTAFLGGALNVGAVLAYGVAIQMCASVFPDFGGTFLMMDPTRPVVDVAASTGVLAGDPAILFWLGAVLVGALVPAVAAFFAKKGKAAVACFGAAVACAVVGAVCMRVVFYMAGIPIFVLF